MKQYRSPLPVKMVGKHIKGCTALRNEKDGTWDTCWGPTAFGHYGDPLITTTRRYGKNGRRYIHWIRYVCNNCACRAELHIQTDYILHKLSKEKE